MATNNRRKQPNGLSDQNILIFGGVAIALLALALAWCGWWLGTLLKTHAAPPMTNPYRVAFGLADRSLTWPGFYGWIAVGLVAVAMCGVVAAGFWFYAQRRRGRSRVDDAAKHMGVGRDIESLRERHAAEVAKRLGVQADTPGIVLGRLVASGAKVYMTWEDLLIAIAGPRTGKTTCLVIPSILDAPGPVLATSNKRDIIDAVRGPRSCKGTVWAFDPQQVCDEPQTWWWNPLSYVTDETKADKLAGYFMAATTDPDARKDAFFDSAGQNLVSALLLAAALDGLPITRIWHWLTHPNDRRPVDILIEHEYEQIADGLEADIDAPDKQRQGVYATAMRLCRVLTNRRAMRWVNPPAEGTLPCFDAAAFVRSDDTLCSMSREGEGSAGALTLALTAAVTEAAEAYARTLPGGRLQKPMLNVLDEAANVCRWRDLPDLYSHYGSRGIIIETFLQSWSQGEGVWGAAGMKKLWSAANMSLYMGGVREEGFLRDMSGLVGEYEYRQRQVGFQQGHSSSNVSNSRDTILSIDDLASLPRGRELLLSSGNRPVLLKTMPWMRRADADSIQASINDANGTGDEA